MPVSRDNCRFNSIEKKGGNAHPISMSKNGTAGLFQHAEQKGSLQNEIFATPRLATYLCIVQQTLLAPVESDVSGQTPSAWGCQRSNGGGGVKRKTQPSCFTLPLRTLCPQHQGGPFFSCRNYWMLKFSTNLYAPPSKPVITASRTGLRFSSKVVVPVRPL